MSIFNLFGLLGNDPDPVVSKPMSADDVRKRLEGISDKDIQDEIDTDLPSDQENIDWLKYLKGQSTATPSPAKSGNSVILIGGIGAFVLVVLLFTVFSKK